MKEELWRGIKLRGMEPILLDREDSNRIAAELCLTDSKDVLLLSVFLANQEKPGRGLQSLMTRETLESLSKSEEPEDKRLIRIINLLVEYRYLRIRLAKVQNKEDFLASLE